MTQRTEECLAKYNQWGLCNQVEVGKARITMAEKRLGAMALWIRQEKVDRDRYITPGAESALRILNAIGPENPSMRPPPRPGPPVTLPPIPIRPHVWRPPPPRPPPNPRGQLITAFLQPANRPGPAKPYDRAGTRDSGKGQGRGAGMGLGAGRGGGYTGRKISPVRWRAPGVRVARVVQSGSRGSGVSYVSPEVRRCVTTYFPVTLSRSVLLPPAPPPAPK
jgi:hypothetical protein